MKLCTAAKRSSSDPYSAGCEANSTTRCVRRLFCGEYGTSVTPEGSSIFRSILQPVPSNTMKPVSGATGSYTISRSSPDGSVENTTGRIRFFCGAASGIGRSGCSREKLPKVRCCLFKLHEEPIEPASLTDLGRKRHDPGPWHQLADTERRLDAFAAALEAEKDVRDLAKKSRPLLAERKSVAGCRKGIEALA